MQLNIAADYCVVASQLVKLLMTARCGIRFKQHTISGSERVYIAHLCLTELQLCAARHCTHVTLPAPSNQKQISNKQTRSNKIINEPERISSKTYAATLNPSSCTMVCQHQRSLQQKERPNNTQCTTATAPMTRGSSVMQNVQQKQYAAIILQTKGNDRTSAHGIGSTAAAAATNSCHHCLDVAATVHPSCFCACWPAHLLL